MSDFNININAPFGVVDPEKLSEDFERELDAAIAQVQEEIEWSWRTKAATQLDTSRQEYLEGLSFEPIPTGMQVTVTGWVANMVENGHKSFDMHDTLLKGYFEGVRFKRSARVIPMGKPPGSRGFATITNKDKPGSWIWKEKKHPGGVKLHEQVQEEVTEQIAPRILGSLMSRIKI